MIFLYLTLHGEVPSATISLCCACWLKYGACDSYLIVKSFQSCSVQFFPYFEVTTPAPYLFALVQYSIFPPSLFHYITPVLLHSNLWTRPNVHSTRSHSYEGQFWADDILVLWQFPLWELIYRRHGDMATINAQIAWSHSQHGAPTARPSDPGRDICWLALRTHQKERDRDAKDFSGGVVRLQSRGQGFQILKGSRDGERKVY